MFIHGTYLRFFLSKINAPRGGGKQDIFILFFPDTPPPFFAYQILADSFFLSMRSPLVNNEVIDRNYLLNVASDKVISEFLIEQNGSIAVSLHMNLGTYGICIHTIVTAMLLKA